MTDYHIEEFTIYNISDSGYAWGESTDSQLSEVCLGPLKCAMEDKVTAVPVSGTEQPFEISICVDNQKWTDGYIGTMVNMVTEKKEEEVTEILYEFASITPTNLRNIGSSHRT